MKELTEKKRIIIIFLVILLGLCSIKALDLLSYNFVKAKAVHYLCDKYDADKEEFELVDYLHSGFHEKPKGEWVDFINWHDFSFEFKYKNKSFFVNRYKGKFYDDYQIEDIEKWCTEWLQQNVDENIISVIMDSETLIKYYSENQMSNKEIIVQDNIKNFIEKSISIPDNDFSILVYWDDDKTFDNNAKIINKVESEMKSVFILDEVPLGSSSVKKSEIEKTKSELGMWKTYYF